MSDTWFFHDEFNSEVHYFDSKEEALKASSRMVQW